MSSNPKTIAPGINAPPGDYEVVGKERPAHIMVGTIFELGKLGQFVVSHVHEGKQRFTLTAHDDAAKRGFDEKFKGRTTFDIKSRDNPAKSDRPDKKEPVQGPEAPGQDQGAGAPHPDFAA